MSDRNGKIFCTSIASLSHISKNSGVETSLIAEKLKMQRSNVSSLLNSLVKDGEVIKDDSSRPVLYRLNDKTVNNDNCVFDNLIGCKESLKNAIQLAKAAVLYPNKSLNVLLTSPRGAGRSYFAYNIYLFARESHVIIDNAPFIKINCKFYENNIEDSNDDLFGLNDDINKSCFSKARGGVLFIDNFNLLNPRQQSRILYYLETGLLFDEDYKNYIEVKDLMVIIGCSLNEANNLSNKFSVVIELPGFVDKSFNERFELINYFFSIEAKNSSRAVEATDEAIIALLLSEYSFNIKELQNCIKSACANAYVKVANNDDSNILVGINDFSGAIKRNLLKRKYYTEDIEKLIKFQKNVYYSKETGYLNEDNEFVIENRPQEVFVCKDSSTIVNKSKIEFSDETKEILHDRVFNFKVKVSSSEIDDSDLEDVSGGSIMELRKKSAVML